MLGVLKTSRRTDMKGAAICANVLSRAPPRVRNPADGL